MTRRRWRWRPGAQEFWGSVGLTLIAVVVAVCVMGVMG